MIKKFDNIIGLSSFNTGVVLGFKQDKILDKMPDLRFILH